MGECALKWRVLFCTSVNDIWKGGLGCCLDWIHDKWRVWMDVVQEVPLHCIHWYADMQEFPWLTDRCQLTVSYQPTSLRNQQEETHGLLESRVFWKRAHFCKMHWSSLFCVAHVWSLVMVASHLQSQVLFCHVQSTVLRIHSGEEWLFFLSWIVFPLGMLRCWGGQTWILAKAVEVPHEFCIELDLWNTTCSMSLNPYTRSG